MLKIVKKTKKKLSGEIVIPADKSLSHRAIMLLSLAKGSSVIHNFSMGKDCISTLNLFKSLGTDINYIDDRTLKINSTGKLLPNTNSNVYFCGNSGTTMRLISGILAGQNFNSILTGDESLSKRTMKRIAEPLKLMGANITLTDNHSPIYITGKRLHGIEYTSNLSSAQVKSCVLLAGLDADGVTSYNEPFLSRNHTEKMLEYFEADISYDKNKISVRKSQLQTKDIDIAGDISSAAFFIVAGLIIPNSDILIKNVGLNYTRCGIVDVVKRMGGNIELLNRRIVSNEEIGDIRVQYTENLKSCEISKEDIPRLIDEIPIIAILATQCNGQTVIKDAQDLRNKESDRIKGIVHEMKKIGADIIETENGMVISGKTVLKGNSELNSYYDHRLAMSFYIAGCICAKEIVINNFECINISFPEFENLFDQLL